MYGIFTYIYQNLPLKSAKCGKIYISPMDPVAMETSLRFTSVPSFQPLSPSI